jgi:hypothetical protein
MSRSLWDDVQIAFKKRGKDHQGISDEDRWFKAWDIMFSQAPRPESPCKFRSFVELSNPIRNLLVMFGWEIFALIDLNQTMNPRCS